MIAIVKIPRDRIKVLNSRDHKFKREIEKRLGIKISFDSNIVQIDGDDSLNVLQVKSIVEAIGRGFSPQRARVLFNNNKLLEIISLRGFTKSRIHILKSRIIGEEGKSRRKIERYTNSLISVYGDTVSIIGDWKEAKNTKHIINMFIEGVSHGSIYRFLESL